MPGTSRASNDSESG